MDVSQEILNYNLRYGASDNTAPQNLVGAKALNYANGASIQKPILENVSVIPRRLQYADAVGLFGAENVFIKVDLKVKDTGNACYEEIGWQCMHITEGNFPIENTYTQALIDKNADLITVNTYEPAEINNDLPAYLDPYVGVALTNLKTGNKYIDAWLDVRLYTKQREEHPYNVMFLPPNDFFYIGFHARNTKRLPYNVECLIGSSYVPKNQLDPRFIAKVN
jgi:hypothetical protein